MSEQKDQARAVLTDLKALIDGETNQSNDVLGLTMTPVETSEPAALGGGGLQNCSGGAIPENGSTQTLAGVNGGEHQVNLDPNLNLHCYFNPDPNQHLNTKPHPNLYP